MPVQTYYRQYGNSGHAVVLIHGVGLDHSMWDATAQSLAASGHRVVRYDMLGHGRTPPLQREVELQDFTTQLETLLQDLNISAAAVVGFSLGALVARAYALRYRARLTHLVLLSSVYTRSEQQRNAVRQRYDDARKKGLSSLIDSALQRWFSDEFAQARPEVLEQVRERLQNNELRGFLPAYRVFVNADDEAAEQLATIAVPTLVVTGAQDVGSTPTMSAQLAQRIPRSRLQVLEGVRHMLPVERAEWLSETLHEFIAEMV